MNDFLNNLLIGTEFSTTYSIEAALLVLLMSFCLGHVVAWVYMWTHTGLSYSRVFVASLLVIPIIVSVVMMLMMNNFVIAFGLLAIFSVIRFRNALKDTRDTVFILWVIALGMAVGTQRFLTSIIGTVFISLVFLYIRFTWFGTRLQYDIVLSLQWTREDPYLKTIKPILNRYSYRIQLASERSAVDRGQDLSYRLALRDPTRARELVSDLEQTEGVQHVSVYHREDESEL